MQSFPKVFPSAKTLWVSVELWYFLRNQHCCEIASSNSLFDLALSKTTRFSPRSKILFSNSFIWTSAQPPARLNVYSNLWPFALMNCISTTIRVCFGCWFTIIFAPNQNNRLSFLSSFTLRWQIGKLAHFAVNNTHISILRLPCVLWSLVVVVVSLSRLCLLWGHIRWFNAVSSTMLLLSSIGGHRSPTISLPPSLPFVAIIIIYI